VGVCALVENMPSGTAQRPGDVVTAASGQTIEVLNTDAEGRLILADAVWYAQEKLGATTVVDLATLTGAMVIALGNEFAGLFANHDELASQLLAAAEASGDRLWRMPLAENYDKKIDSPIADVKNISGGREAGSAMGAHFIGRFIREGVKWAHLDIAGMAWASKDQPLTPKGATGYGVRLLERFVAGALEGAQA
jgi:leucyl aminopeptidase